MSFLHEAGRHTYRMILLDGVPDKLTNLRGEQRCLGDDTRWLVAFYFLTRRWTHRFNSVTIEKHGYFYALNFKLFEKSWRFLFSNNDYS